MLRVRVKVLGAALVSVGLMTGTLAVSAAPAVADEADDFFDEFYDLDWDEWLFRSKSKIVDNKKCWAKADPPRLEAKINGVWKQVAKPRLSWDAFCDGGGNYRATYFVTPSRTGFSLDGKDKQTIALRSTNGKSTANFSRYVWASRSVHDQEVTDRLSKTLQTFNDVLEDVVSGSGSGLPSSGSGLSSSGWSGCYYMGQKMWGTVKVVEYGFADYDVKIVDYGADLNVKPIEFGFASSCGEWKLTEYGFADFSVKFVDYGIADFDIKLVSYGAGR